MITEVTYRLLQDVGPMVNKKAKPYALKGDIVTEIQDHGHFAIVEFKGNRFSVSKDKMIKAK